MNIPSRVNPFGYDNSVPAGYTRLEYLESTGAQYILLPPMPRTHKLFIDFQILSETGTLMGYYEKADSGARALGVETYQDISLRCFIDGNWPGIYSRNIHERYSFLFTPKTDNKLEVRSGTTVKTSAFDLAYSPTMEFGLFRAVGTGYIAAAKLWVFSNWDENGTLARNLIPALDPTGIPCMFDTVTGQPFRNSGTGQFTAGLTMTQALNLANLPATGGSMTVSLPLEAAFDAGVESALNAAADKGWTITVQYRESELTTKNIPADFLESTGTQGIQIPHVFDKNTGLKYVGIVRRSSSWTNGGSTWLDTARRVEMLLTNPTNNSIGVGEYGTAYNGVSVAILNTETKTIASYNWLNRKLLQVETSGGKREVYNDLYVGNRTSPAIGVLCKSDANGAVSSFEQGTIFEVSVSQDETIEVNVIPTLDSSGTPCMYDTVSGQNFYNANTAEGATPFIVGFDTTEKAAVSLSKLPRTTGGTLTVSLPAAAQDTDTLVPEAIDIATSRGWTIITQYRED